MIKDSMQRWLRTFRLLTVLLLASALSVAWIGISHSSARVTQVQLTDLEKLGKAIFIDQQLSVNKNMSCATCHAVEAGGTAASDHSNRILGLHPGSKFESYNQLPSANNTFAFRNIQTNTYSVYSPPLHREQKEGGGISMVGGNFWDGRAMGFITGRPTQEQAMVPPLGTLEGELPAAACVVKAVVDDPSLAEARAQYKQVFGSKLETIQWPASIDADCTNTNAVIDMPSAQDDISVQRVYSNLSNALWAYQRSSEIVPFSSRFDASADGKVQLTDSERRGLDLFNGKAHCANCHVSTPRPGLSKPLFTDFTYDNIGIPRNPSNPVYTFSMINPDGWNWVDQGLGAVLRHDDTLREQAADNIGKFKVPTVRNVDKRPNPDFVRAYMHNGYFRSLEQVVDFYNTRDVKPRCENRFTTADSAEQQGCWPEPEISENLNTQELGNLGLTQDETSDLIAFLKTLSDESKNMPRVTSIVQE